MRCEKCGHIIKAPIDLNHCTVGGEIVSNPTAVTIKNGKQMCLFTLKTQEKFESNGKKSTHDNFFTIEILGKNSDRALESLNRGDRCIISGYLRCDDLDGVEKVRVRAFTFQKE